MNTDSKDPDTDDKSDKSDNQNSETPKKETESDNQESENDSKDIETDNKSENKDHQEGSDEYKLFKFPILTGCDGVLLLHFVFNMHLKYILYFF